jgi:nucleoid DNA-binding protein
MKHRETVDEIARRLPKWTRADVAEAMEVMAEVWMEALREPGAKINVVNLGRLHIQTQKMKCRGAVRDKLAEKGKPPEYLIRVYCRFDPFQPLAEICEQLREEAQSNE